MNATAIDYCETCNNPLITKRVIVKFIYIMIYLCIYVINYRRVNAYFDAKEEGKEEGELDEIDEYEDTSEQLMRLRSYNPKFDGETDNDYAKRILDMAYREDEKKEIRKNEGEKREKREMRKRKRE